MVINETYVNESVILRMVFVPDYRYNKELGEYMEPSHADIFTTTDSQIQVRCTKEEYMEALKQLAGNK